MRINRQVVVFDAADLAAESSFWAGVLDGTVDEEDDWHRVMVDGESRVAVQLAPNHVPPDWPDGTPGAADPPRPVGRGLRGRPRSCHVARWTGLKTTSGMSTPQTTSRSTRILPGIRSVCAGINNASSCSWTMVNRSLRKP